MKVIVWLVLLLPMMALKCQRDCYPSKEPDLKVFFQDGSQNFQRVYGLHGKGDIIKREGFYYLPVSLLADSVSYIFENPGQTDTLTIYYTRNFFFESERCGYEAEIREDFSRGQTVSSTFTAASVTFSEGRNFDRNIYALTIYQ